MTKLQKSKVCGAFKTMMKAIAQYEAVVAEVWAVDDDPRYTVEVFISTRDADNLNISDSVIVANRTEAESMIMQAKAFADKAIGGIEDSDTTVTPTSIEATYHTEDGHIAGDFYTYFEEV